MAESMTREQAIEHNKARGVVPYKSGERQSDDVWVVTDGVKYLPNHERQSKPTMLGPGNLFHPTEGQVANKGRSLKNKARPLYASEYAGLRGTRAQTPGADIGVRSLNMADSTATYAIQSGLTEKDFEGVEPEGANNRYTKAQVEAMVEARSLSDAA